MGLKFPENLEEWRAWSRKQNTARYLKTQLTQWMPGAHQASPDPSFVFARATDIEPQVLVGLDATTPTQVAALLLPGESLLFADVPTGVIAPAAHADWLTRRGFDVQINFTPATAPALHAVTQVIAAGHYLPVGDWLYQQAQRQGWGFNVVQHGIHTPFVPPLPAHSTLFAFSAEDAEFWRSGRTDVNTHVVGSQLFFEAQDKPKVAPEDVGDRLTFLGQMHGAELPRYSFAHASYTFCSEHDAVYRPHPAETDKLSILTHALWEKRGVTIDRSKSPLNQLNDPVVSIFSTGVLEAAMRGVPSWVYHPNPPAWLQEFWARYGMNQYGQAPTPAPAFIEEEPAQLIAQHITQQL
ncbi:RNA-binding protein [Rothia sp. LK2588]|uniref:RNA-binding protein n=1 Tax=Rothia sp. LK2588 TaxID=3114369 RepID=UPI0034CE5999